MARLLAGLVLLLSASAALGAMERGPKPRSADEPEPSSGFARAEAAARAGECRKATLLLVDVLEAAQDDADTWNLLAYCQRKTGKLEEAFANYRRALELRPKFPAAREYLGEAHLQAAIEQVEILRGYGESAKPELDRLIAALREAASRAAGSGAAAPASSSW